MDRRFPLETQLLSRSHAAQTSLQLLSDRYNPPYLSLDGSSSTKRQQLEQQQLHKASIFSNISKPKASSKNRKKSQSIVKKQLRSFITKNQRLQKLYKHKHTNEIQTQMIKYDEYVKLNALWIGYIIDLLSINTSTDKKGSLSKTNLKMMLQKLSGAEFVGCHINVLKSNNKDLLGKNGIILVDTMKYFIIVEDINGGQLKMLMKDGSVFNYVIPLNGIDEVNGVLEFSIIGSRVCYRSDDRATRKFKARASDDLSVLLEPVITE